MKRFIRSRFALSALVLALPVCALADINDTKTLSSNSNLSLDTGTTGTGAGGDILWNGTSLTPQGAAKAAVLPFLTGATTFNGLTQITLQVFLTTPGLASSAALPSSSIPVGTIIAVTTNAGRPAKLLVTAIGSSITLQFTTFGATGSGGGGGGGNGAPTISRVTNNSSDIPSGFPNSGLSQGALFKVVGSNLADDGDGNLHDSNAQGGLPTTLNNAKITVTVGTNTLSVALYYATPTQIDGVLPSNTPTGSGTLTVTHNGVASAAFSITVVAAAPGITTYNNGTAVAQDFARPTDPFGGLVTFQKSAAPGGIMTIWGSGFGATNDSDTSYTGTPHAVSASYTIYIGGVQVTNLGYAGRSQYPGVHIFVLTIPQGVPTGCYVPIVAVATVNGVTTVSNIATLPIRAGGGVCSDPLLGIAGDQVSTLSGQTNLKIGGVNVIQSTSPGLGGGSTTSSLAGASFFQVTGSSFAGGGGTVSIGGCIVSQTSTSSSGGGSTGTVTGLDAGTVTVTPPGGSAITLTGIPGFAGYYSAQLSSIPSTGGAFVFRGTGGSQVGAFNATVNFPNPILSWPNPNAAANVNRSQNLTVTWDGGAPGTYVAITGSSINIAAGASGGYTCLAPAENKQFTVPSYVLLTLPAGTGTTSLYNYTTPAPFSASGLDYAGASGIVSIAVNSNYN